MNIQYAFSPHLRRVHERIAADPVFGHYVKTLSKRPYCADGDAAKREGRGFKLLILPRDDALGLSHLQPNLPCLKGSMVFDVDRRDAEDAFEDAGLPAPHFVVQNPRSGHVQFTYMLRDPVQIGPHARQGVVDYALAIERGFIRRLGADEGYSGFLARNPFHENVRTRRLASEPYTLPDLHGWLEPRDMRVDRAQEPIGSLGRNCALFDHLRRWAYRNVGSHRGHPQALPVWLALVAAKAHELNAEFGEPLGEREVHSIAKSVAKWTLTRFGRGVSAREFSDVQADRGRRSGIARSQKAASRLGQLRQLLVPQPGPAAGYRLPAAPEALLTDLVRFPTAQLADLAANLGVSVKTVRSDLAKIGGIACH
ncbi:MAG: replication initiation protein [Hyphomicrobium sp.]